MWREIKYLKIGNIKKSELKHSNLNSVYYLIQTLYQYGM